MVDTRRLARQWTRDHGDDLPEVRDWQWDAGADPERGESPSTTADPDTGADNL
jgi:xylulose-5-phosphate/fructose-6-phosphate phosphoketolase